MARPRTHSDEDILGAVRALLVDEGPRAVTTTAVSKLSGAPTGTLYHRFGSRANMIAELWIRTVRRLQTAVLAAGDGETDEVEAAVAMALATVDFCAANPDDARLLTLASRERLRNESGLSASTAADLETLNQPLFERLDRLAEHLHEAGDGSLTLSFTSESVTYAVISLPYVAVRQAVGGGNDPAVMRAMVEAGARAVLVAFSTDS